MMESRHGRRVVVTGLGVIAPCGIGVSAFWDGLAKPVEPAVLRRVVGFDPQQFGTPRVDARRLDRFAQFAVAAAAQALVDAGFANAARWIAAGRCDTALAGGAEACLTGTNIAGFTNMRALSPSGVSRPFDVERDGFCASEGAGVLVLEEASYALARGARAYAEIAGSASTADSHHITAPAPHGRGALACMRLALADAGIAPGDVSHVNAHGTSTPLNDAIEAAVIAEVFGGTGSAPAVTSVKGVTGHSLGAAGAIEAVTVALSYRHRELPPTMGTTLVDASFDVDVVLSARPWTPGVALSNSFGFGGLNGAIVFVPA